MSCFFKRSKLILIVERRNNKLLNRMMVTNVADVGMVEDWGAAKGGNEAHSASGAGKVARSSWERVILYVLVGALAAFAITYPVTRNAFKEDEKLPTPTSAPTSPQNDPIGWEDVVKTNNRNLQWKKYNMVSIGDHYWTFVWGIMTVPLDHSDAKSPLLNLRVSFGIRDDATTEDLKHPLISHCGGPGSSDDCATAFLGLRTGRKLIFGILQRGMKTVSEDNTQAYFPGAQNFFRYNNLEVELVRGEQTSCWNISQTPENLTVARFPATNKKECECWLPEGDISSVKERLPAYNALPDDIAEMEKLFRWISSTSRRCYKSSRWVLFGIGNSKYYNFLDYVGTGDLVRDIEQLRLSIAGVDTFDCYGVSYGTGVCSVYSATFPTSVRRVVLDGNIGSEPNVENFFNEVGIASNQIAYQLISMCERLQGMSGEDPTGGCKSRGREFATLYRELRLALGQGKVSATIGEYTVTPPENSILSILQVGVFRDSGILDWLPKIFPTLWRLIDRDNEAIVQAIREKCVFLEDSRDCWDPSWFDSPMKDTDVVRGLDYAGRYSFYTAAHLSKNIVTKYGPEEAAMAIAWSKGLFAWPAPAVPQVLGSRQDVKALIIGTLFDPATPFYNAKKMRDKFPGGVLVTYQGGGHGIQTNSPGGEKCQSLINSFLLNDTLPFDGSVCREKES